MSSTYDVVSNPHPAHLDAWEGHNTICSPPCTTNQYNLSLAAQDLSDVPSSWTRSYIPHEVSHYTSNRKIDSGVKWGMMKRAKLLRMTPLYNERIVTDNFLVGVPKLGDHISRTNSRRCYASTWQCCPGSCNIGYQVITCNSKALQFDYSHWDEQGDLEKFQLVDGLGVYQTSWIDPSAVSNAVVGTREAASLKSFRDYDALTDLFQFPGMVKELHGTMASFYRILCNLRSRFSTLDLAVAARRRPVDLLKCSSRTLRKLASAWLAYRYSVMTTLMSINDIRKVVSRINLVKDKSSRTITPTSLSPSHGSSWIERSVSGSKLVTSTVTSRYAMQAIMAMSRVGVNPLSTAWELIPYSFVVDWFVNVGDYILAVTNVNFATQVIGCTSVKTETEDSYTVHYSGTQNIAAGSYGSGDTFCWPSGSIPNHPAVTTSPVDGLLRSVKTERYDRTVFHPEGQVNLSFNPNISWRRMIDSCALTLNLIKGGK